MTKKANLLVALLVFELGCAGTHRATTPPMPPMPPQAAKGPLLRTPAAVQVSGFTLAWTNLPSAYSTNYVTAIEESLDLAHWTLLSSVPYEQVNTMVVTNDAPFRFFRVYNTIKPNNPTNQ